MCAVAILRFYKIVKFYCFSSVGKKTKYGRDKIFFIGGFSPIEAKAELDATLEESAPSVTTVKTGIANFKRGAPQPKKASRKSTKAL